MLEGQLRLLEAGLISQAAELETHVTCDQVEASGAGSTERGASLGAETLLAVERYVRVCLQDKGDIDNKELEEVKTKHIWELKRQSVLQFFKTCVGSKCPNCQAPVRPIRQEYHARIFQRPLSQKMASAWVAAQRRLTANETGDTSTESLEDCLKQKYVTPLEARSHLRKLLESEHSVLTLAFGCLELDASKDVVGSASPADVFFLDILPVPPSRFRPVSVPVALSDLCVFGVV